MRLLKIILVMGLIFIGLAICEVKDKSFLSNFEKIKIGTPEEEILKQFGKPKIISKECKWEFVTKDVPNCAELFVYASIWAPLFPTYPVVWFDKNHQVIDKYIYQSP